MSPLRVALFTEIYRPAMNGVVASVETLAAALESRGHSVFCVAPKMDGEDGSDRRVLRIPSLPLPVPAGTPYRLTLPLMSRRNVKGLIADLDVIHVHSPFVTGWMGVRYARRFGIPLIYTYHTQLEEYAHYVPFEPNATRYAASQLTRTFANLADAVIAPTPAMNQRLRELGVRSRIETLPSGIDVGLFGSGRRRPDVRERLGAREGEILLLYVGRLAREKNVELLLRAMASAGGERLRLAIVGDGPHHQDLVGLALSLGVAGVTRFAGAIPRPELPDIYAGADAFVMPSTTETQGLVQVEALAAGLPVIAADAPQNRDVLGETGELVESKPEAFAAAFHRIRVPRDDEAAGAARLHAQRFSLERYVDRVVALYESVASPARSA
jgi:glycosyltransferase involved in cell wall biosynthesis